MTLDQIHLGVTGTIFLAGLIYIAVILPKVGPVRRVTYVLAIPLWVVFVVLYTVAFFDYHPRDAAFSPVDIALRVALFGIAVEGILVPFVDRLEAKNRPQEVRLVREDDR